jgi:general stress protein 26
MRPVLLLVLFVLLPSPATAQATPAPPSRGDILAASRDIMQKARYCTLVTIGEDGHPQARIVDPLGPDASFTTWIATNPLTRKVAQIRRDARVTLSCFDAATSSYVTVLGRGAIVTDAAEKARRWKEEWTPFYAGGANGTDVMLIRLTPIRLEIVSVERGFAGDEKTWRPLTVDFPAAPGAQ